MFQLFDHSQAEFETVLTPQDFERAAHLADALNYQNSDIWDSDAMYSRSRFEGDIANENVRFFTGVFFKKLHDKSLICRKIFHFPTVVFSSTLPYVFMRKHRTHASIKTTTDFQLFDD